MESEKFQSIQDFLLVYSYSVLSLSYDRQEQVRGIEPPSSAWKADILAIVRHLHVGLPSFGRPGKPWMFTHPLLRFPLSRSAQDGNRTRTLSPARDFLTAYIYLFMYHCIFIQLAVWSTFLPYQQVKLN